MVPRMGWIKLSLHLCFFIGILLLAAVPASAADQGTAPAPCPTELGLTSDEVAARLMERNAERAEKLRQVDSTRQYSLDYTGFPALSARMEVTASYTVSGTKEFHVISESGSSILRKHVLHKLLESEQEAASDAANRDAARLSTANYRFSLLGCEAGDGRPLYVMRVEPLRQTKFLYRGTIWIDSQDFAVTRIEAEPAKNPSFWTVRSRIHHQYEKIGEFYLPALNQTVTDVRVGGKAVLTIRYLNYKLLQLSADGTRAAQQ